MVMEQCRDGEQNASPDRKNRFFKHGDNWFFTTRECSIIGPYDSYQEAVEGCQQFVTQIESISKIPDQPDQCA